MSLIINNGTGQVSWTSMIGAILGGLGRTRNVARAKFVLR